MSGTGERQWDSLGVGVGAINDDDWYLFGCVAAGAGFIASWPRNSHGPTRWDIYAQHVDAAGQLLWGEPGLGIAVDSGHDSRAPCVVTDARQGAIITWAVGGGLKAQRAGDVTGFAGPLSVTRLQSVIQAHPSPARSAVEILLPRPSASVVIADAVGRVVRELRVPHGVLSTTWDLRDVKGSRVPAGVYVFRQRESGTSLGRVVVMNS
jgi:hypothetical protein